MLADRRAEEPRRRRGTSSSRSASRRPSTWATSPRCAKASSIATTLISGNGEPAAVVSVARQIRGNILAIADGVEQTLREQAASLPPAIRISKVYDLAAFVRDAVASVGEAIVIGGLLAVFVLLAFLRDWRATFVAATTLPLTIVGTFFILHLAGGTINLMSMGGLAIAIGLVIDDAIVVVENIHRHLGAGRDAGAWPPSAARNELVGAVIGSTLTTVVVFIPLGLLQGMVGQFFAALSLTLSAAVLLSLVYALLLHPDPGGAVPAAARRRDARASRLAQPPVRGASAARAARPALGRSRVTLRRRRRRRAALLPAGTGFLPEMDEGGYVIDYLTPTGHVAAGNRPHGAAGSRPCCKATPEIAGFTRRTGTEMGMFATRAEQRRHPRAAEAARPAATKRRGNRSPNSASSSRKRCRA